MKKIDLYDSSRTAGHVHLRLAIAAISLFIALFAKDALALGTAAGTLINNSVQMTYTMSGTNYSGSSNVNTIRVNEVINNTTTWQDTLPGVSVSPGQANSVVTMKLTNTGNAPDSYTLAAISTSPSGTWFTATPTATYLDTNSNGIYDPGTDALYVPGTNDPIVNADQYITLFIVSTIPSTALVDGQKGAVQLTCTSKTGSGAPGTFLPGVGPGGSDVIVGHSGGASSALGIYVVSTVAISIIKSATVTDVIGGNQVMTNSIIHYTLNVTATGSGSAMNVVIRDAIPANTTYLPNTLKLNNVGLTDAADSDAGDVNATTPGTVTVSLPGSITSATPAQSIAFDVRIN
jgi:uncharacterized repeat protein (TIGR01451 family)